MTIPEPLAERITALPGGLVLITGVTGSGKTTTLAALVEMMNRANVAVSPGAGFGEEGEGYLRLALVENENRIRQALKQMRRALSDIDQEINAGTFNWDNKELKL